MGLCFTKNKSSGSKSGSRNQEFSKLEIHSNSINDPEKKQTIGLSTSPSPANKERSSTFKNGFRTNDESRRNSFGLNDRIDVHLISNDSIDNLIQVLNITEVSNIQDSNIKALNIINSRGHMIKSLTINLSICSHNMEKCYEVLNAMEKLNTLISLEIDATANYKQKCDELIQPISKILSLSKSTLSVFVLKLSALNIANDMISNQGMKIISEALANLKSLSTLELDFSDNVHIDEKGMDHLAKALLNCSSITRLYFDFGGINKRGEINDDTLNIILNPLLRLTSLKELTLNFSRNKISNKGINHLADTLSQLELLTKLSLNFAYNRSIDDNGIQYISNLLGKLNLLTEITLNFQNNMNITDKSIEYLSTVLLHCNKMNKIDLNFIGCNLTKIGDSNIYMLMKS